MDKPCVSEHSYCNPPAELIVHSSGENLMQHIINCVVQEVVPREFKEEILKKTHMVTVFTGIGSICLRGSSIQC